MRLAALLGIGCSTPTLVPPSRRHRKDHAGMCCGDGCRCSFAGAQRSRHCLGALRRVRSWAARRICRCCRPGTFGEGGRSGLLGLVRARPGLAPPPALSPQRVYHSIWLLSFHGFARGGLLLPRLPPHARIARSLPSLQLIFIDELDALAPARSGPGGRPSAISSTSARMVATLATEMDMLRGGA